MQTDVAKEILDVVRILPEDKQRQILKQAETLAQEERRSNSLWDKIRVRSEKIPKKVWDNMPLDGSENHDRYLNDASKK